MAAGFTAGAILGGLLTDLLSWRWAFFINIPIAVFVLTLAPKLLTESARGNKTKLDIPGAVTVTLALLLLVFGLTTAGEKGWADTLAWGPLAAGLFLFVVFFFIEKNTPHALVPVTILRRNNIAWGNIAGILAFATETSLVFVLTLYLQQALGYTPLGAGLAFAVLGIGTVVGGIIAPKLLGKLGNKNTIITGLTIQAAATGSLLFINTDQASLVIVLTATFVGGVANLAAIVGFMVTATTGLPDTEQGLATGLATMSQQIGITMGIPVMSTLIAAALLGHGASSDAQEQVLAAVLPAIGINAALCLAAALLTALFLRRPAPAAG
jgi:MFS family permease